MVNPDYLDRLPTFRDIFRYSILSLLILISAFTSVGAQPDTVLVENESPRYQRFIPIPLFSLAPETSARIGVIGVYFFRFKNAKRGTQLSSLRLRRVTHFETRSNSDYQMTFSLTAMDTLFPASVSGCVSRSFFTALDPRPGIRIKRSTPHGSLIFITITWCA